MPFTPTPSPTYSRLYAFVDQFDSGDAATRVAFDTYFADLQVSINEIIDYLINYVLARSGAYVGLSDTPPVDRQDDDITPSALREGDIYISSATATLGTLYVWKSSAWTVANSLGVNPTTIFKSMASAVTAADLRGILGLASAAVQDESAFATAAQGAKADNAIQAPGGLSRVLTDWNAASTNTTGFYHSDSGSVNAPVAEPLAGTFIKRAAGSGVMYVTSATTGRIFSRIFNSSWQPWSEILFNRPQEITDIDAVSGNVAIGFFSDTATGAPDTGASYTALLEQYAVGTDIIQRATIMQTGQALIRQYSTSWSAWFRDIERGTIGPVNVSGTEVILSNIPPTATTVKVTLHNFTLASSRGCFQLISGGSIISTGYTTSVMSIASGGAVSTDASVGYAFPLTASGIQAPNLSLSATFTRKPGTSLWSVSCDSSNYSGGKSFLHGHVDLAGNFEGIRLVALSGSAALSGGQIFIEWER